MARYTQFLAVFISLILLIAVLPQDAVAVNNPVFSKTQLNKLDPLLKEKAENYDSDITSGAKSAKSDPSYSKFSVLVKKQEAKQGMLGRIFGSEPPKSTKEAIKEKNIKIKNEFDDYIAVDVSLDQLAQIADSDSVGNIYLDREYSTLLDESVPVVNADKARDLGYNGFDVKIAVLDTGIDYENPAFENRVILSEAFTGEDYTRDNLGHGTHVAGIAAGNGRYIGVAPKAFLLNGKVIADNGKGSSSTIIAGVEWAVANGADIISLSIGSKQGLDTPLNDALQNAINKGVVVIAASGNCGPCKDCGGFNGVTSPGNYEDVITVGAVDDNKEYACFSSGQNFGSYIKPDVVAPGVNIISSYLNGAYKSISGTSMATPHIAGIAALLLQKESDLNHYQIKELLINNAIDLGVSGKDIKYGSGFADAGVFFEYTFDEDINRTYNIVEVNFSEADNSVQNITFTNESGTYTIQASCSDYGSTSCSTEGSWTYTGTNKKWLWKCKNMLWIGKLLCWELQSTEGDDNYCTYLNNYLGYKCKHEQGDCDSNSECSSGLECDDGPWGWGNEGCCYSNENFDGSSCNPACSSHSYYGCYSDDIYWYNSCGSKEEKKTECGTSGYVGNNYCYNGDVYRDYETKGCSGSACTSSASRIKQEDCSNGCSNGACISCKSNGQSCSTPGSSTAECCSGICGYSGKCVSCTDQCSPSSYPSCSGNTRYECKMQSDGCYDKIGTTCAYGCSGGSCNPAPSCGDGSCNGNEDKWSCEKDCGAPCASNQCPSYHWEQCYDHGELCCQGDSVFGKYYCKNDNNWANCDSVYGYTLCEKQGNYYCTNDDGILKWRQCPNGCSNGKCIEETCEFPYGASENCSCPLLTCPLGYVCDQSNFRYGTCVISSLCIIPDGSSNDCDCDSNRECPSGYVCDLGSGWDACIAYSEPDECNTIDSYQCREGDVYRCEQVGPRKKLILSDVCTYSEVCPFDVAIYKRCKSIANYDLILEYASSGTVVNKQRGDILVVNVRVDANTNMNLEYDSSVFTLESGRCNTGNFNKGDNICEFRISDSALEVKYNFKLGEDIEIVSIVKEPYSLYITNVDQLYKRYDDNIGVNVLLAKTYEKASQNKGVVYDLGREIVQTHPFDYAFSSYDERLTPSSSRDNQFVIEASRFIHNKCGNCKETIIIGDDYVIPSAINDINLRSGFDILYWNLFSNESDDKYYSDSIYTTRNNDYTLADMQYIFNIYNPSEDRFEQEKQVAIIIPETADQDLLDAIDRFKQTIAYRFNPKIITVPSNEVYSDNFNQIDKTRGRSIVIIGDKEHNRALNSYPYNVDLNSMYLEPSVWDKDEYTLIINTMDPEILDIYSLILYSGSYEQIHAKSMSILDKAIPLAGGLMIIAGIAVCFVPGFQVAGVPLTIAGFALDGASIINECWIDNEGGGNWGGCAFDIGITIASWGIGKWVLGPLVRRFGPVISQKIGKYLLMLKFIDERAVREVVEEGAETAIEQADNAKYLSDGVEFVTKNLDEDLEVIFKNLANNMDDVQRTRFLKNIGIIVSNYGDEAATDLLKLRGIEGVDKLATKILTDTGGGFRHEAKAARILQGRREGLTKLSFDLPAGNGDIDALSKTKLFEMKSGYWVEAPEGTELFESLQKKLSEQISKLKIYDSSKEIVIVFDRQPTEAMKNWLEDTMKVTVEVIT